MKTSLTLKESTYKKLKKHLYPGSDLEFAAIMLCHYGQGKTGFRLMVKELILIPENKCNKQTSSYLSWAFAEYMTPEKIEQIDKEGLSVFTIHSHPNGYDRFSETDDKNDKEMFHAINPQFLVAKQDLFTFIFFTGKQFDLFYREASFIQQLKEALTHHTSSTDNSYIHKIYFL